MNNLDVRLAQIDVGEITQKNFITALTLLEFELKRVLEDFKVGNECINFEMQGVDIEKALCIKINAPIGVYTFSERLIIPYNRPNFSISLHREVCSVISELYKNTLAVIYITKLNNELLYLSKTCDMLLQFDIADNLIVSIGVNHLTLGISIEQALKIPKSLIFDSLNEIPYKNRMLGILKVCQTPAQLLKAKLEIYDELGIYLRSRFELLLRGSFRKKYEYVGKNGVGYILTDDYMALISIVNNKEYLIMPPIDLYTLLYTGDNLGFEEVYLV